ncbi:MAG: AAA family ATPase [Lentimicrobium sp.]
MRAENYSIVKDFPEKEIQKAWDNNEYIQGIAADNSVWILLSTVIKSGGLQRWATNAEFPSKEIKDGWDENYDIIFLDYVKDRWVVILEQGTGFIDQIWRTSSRFPEKEIKQGITDGYVITGLSYGIDRWAVVMSKGTSYRNQTFGTFSDFPEQAITDGWNSNRDITALTYGGGQWGLVMSENTGFVTQSWATRNDFEPELIKEKAKTDLVLSILFFADDKWVYVFTTFKTITNTGITDDAGNRHETALTKVQGPNPEADALLEKGRALANKNEHKKAIDFFRKSLKLSPDSYTAHNSLGVSLDILGQKDEALECFRKAFELCPTDEIILGNLVNQVISNQLPTTEIIEAVEKAGENTINKVDTAVVLNNIAYAYGEAGRNETAIGYYKKALIYDPDNAVIKDNLEEVVKTEADSHVGHYSPPVSENDPTGVSTPESLDFLLKELNKLTGLDEIKQDVDALIKFIKVEKKRKERGIAIGNTTLHTVFAGPPGTGKTTLARLMGRFFKALGILKKGHVIEVDRSALVGEFIGQTAIKTSKVIDSALDGILFIDEAYSLTPSDSRNDFGEEAVNTLVKRMEDHKHNLVVIVAGYEKEMKRFINSNPGLKHRFTRYFYFDDYTPEQLTTIFDAICSEKKFTVELPAESKVTRYFQFLYESKDKQFGNARTAHNLFEEVVRYQSARLGVKDVDKLSDEELLTIKIDDVTAAIKDEFEDQYVETVEEIMAELNQMVGLSEIKQNVLTLINFIRTQKRLIANGHVADEITLHSVFFGPPGTGKTTVARLIGRIYKALDLLSKGHLIEATRADLVAEFVGQTAIKTNEVIDSAMYGVLFIDEAYALTSAKGSNDFGSEAVTALLKRMDDERDKLAVIVAGYTEEMQELIGSNSGLESRFSNYFYFSDYSPSELLEIFTGKVKRKKFEITSDAVELVSQYFTELFNNKSKSFGNGRMVRNFYERLVKAHSNRIAAMPEANREEMATFIAEDIALAIKNSTTIIPANQAGGKRRPIGYNN